MVDIKVGEELEHLISLNFVRHLERVEGALGLRVVEVDQLKQATHIANHKNSFPQVGDLQDWDFLVEMLNGR